MVVLKIIVYWRKYLTSLHKGIIYKSLGHGPSQNGPYSRVRDLLATLTLNFSLIASSSAKSRGAQGIDRLAALG